jgi:DNA polymerase-3 subunit alpha
MNNFIHLRVHSEFSLIDGIVRIKPLIDAVKENNMPAVALTDQSNMYGLIKFYKAALASGIKPIVSSDIWLENPEDNTKPYRVTLIAQNQQGYKHVTQLISLAYSQNQVLEVPIVKKEWLFEHASGVIMLSGFREGDVGDQLLKGNPDQAKHLLEEYQRVFLNRFYIEIQRTGRENEEQLITSSLSLSSDLNIPVVATNDVRFLKKKDFDVHETRVCIGESYTLADTRRVKRYSDQQYFRTTQEMVELFSDVPSAIKNTIEISKRCSVEIVLGKCFLPEFPIPEGMTEAVFFKKISYDGLNERLETILDRQAPDYEERKNQYFQRLDFEIKIITQMEFPGYFLIVMDFIKWAKNNDIPVGPGRGSGAGSLVAYAQKITDIDPLEYDLLFERFLNPERVSMPDFDIDFCMDKRERVIDYVAEHYGRKAVSQIVTFGTMTARALGKSFGLADRLSKLIPADPGMTLSKALEMEPALKELLDDDDANEIWCMAERLEGITRQTGKHAGGVVIAPTQLTDFSPTRCDEDYTGLVTQFDKSDVEEAGLVKFDFLGLRTLTIIDWAVKAINKIKIGKGEEPISIEHIPLDDPEAYKLLKSAQTTAVFQLESRGMKDLIRRLEPENIEEMIALVALFRPGPLESGMVDDFINRKHGRAQVAYPHPDYQHESLKEILEPTYGVIVYQEQVMQIAQNLAGYTLGGADMLRRAMGKKKPEEMAKQRETFKEGAITQNVSPDLAMKIFDLVEKFAGYGFNKSHSAAYAVVSYQTLWLKTHFPSQFMAAVLTSDMQNTDKVVLFFEECQEMKLDLVLPDVNQSNFGFFVNDLGAIVYGLGAVKGAGEGPVAAIVEAREQGGVFTDIFDFCKRCHSKKINKRVLEALVRCGAFDKIGPNRAVLMACIPHAIKSASQQESNAEAGMEDLFGEVEAQEALNEHHDVYSEYLMCREWPLKMRLQGEKETLGLFVTGHPFDEYEKEVRQFAKVPLSRLREDKKVQKLTGQIINMRTMKNKRGENMCFLTLDDRSGRIELSLFSDVYDRVRELIEKDKVIIVEAVVSKDDYSGGLKAIARDVMEISETRIKYANSIKVQHSLMHTAKEMTKQLKNALIPDSTGCPIVYQYENNQARVDIQLGDEWRVRPTDEQLYALQDIFGSKSVNMDYGSK